VSQELLKVDRTGTMRLTILGNGAQMHGHSSFAVADSGARSAIIMHGGATNYPASIPAPTSIYFNTGILGSLPSMPFVFAPNIVRNDATKDLFIIGGVNITNGMAPTSVAYILNTAGDTTETQRWTWRQIKNCPSKMHSAATAVNIGNNLMAVMCFGGANNVEGSGATAETSYSYLYYQLP
jgi:hypothetical protein